MRRGLHDLIRAIRGEGKAVLIATHDMEEAELLCDRVAIIEAGRIVREGAPGALIAAARGATRVILDLSAPPENLLPAPANLIAGLKLEGARLRFQTADLNMALREIIAALDARGIKVLSVRAGAATLEEVVLEIAGQARGDAP